MTTRLRRLRLDPYILAIMGMVRLAAFRSSCRPRAWGTVRPLS